LKKSGTKTISIPRIPNVIPKDWRTFGSFKYHKHSNKASPVTHYATRAEIGPAGPLLKVMAIKACPNASATEFERPARNI